MLNFQGFLLVGPLGLGALGCLGEALGDVVELLGFGGGVGAGIGSPAGGQELVDALLLRCERRAGGGKLVGMADLGLGAGTVLAVIFE